MTPAHRPVVRSVDSPVGPLLLVGDGRRLAGLYFVDHQRAPTLVDPQQDGSAFADAVVQLDQWFAGQRTTFDLELTVAGTEFQRRIWDALVDIPFGRTATYGQVATAAGFAGAARAVGHAVARNPVAIVVPCHRVIGAAGALTGYAGGMNRKRRLLEHEGWSPPAKPL